MLKGNLKKLKIVSYTRADYSEDSRSLVYIATINPESYQLDYKIEYNGEQGQGTNGVQQRYLFTHPEELSFEFLFDATGVLPAPIQGQPRDDIWAELQYFQNVLVGYDGTSHQPRHLKLFWGTLLFKGRLSTLNIQYKLFRPDGRPLRAVATAVFKKSEEEELRVLRENAQSPDVTHMRTVTAGDNLPLLCHRIYGDSRYYLEVARINGLSDFRNLKAGDELIFPPLEKARR